MNIRPQFLACIFGITVLSGCGSDSGGKFFVIALSPVILPITYVGQRSAVVQPVTVVSSSGEQLTPDFTDDAEEIFTVSEETIVCEFGVSLYNGSHFRDKPTDGVSLVCNKELKGEVKIQNALWSQSFDLSMTGHSAWGSGGSWTEVTFTCRGYYDATEGSVDPFLIDCGDDGKAAVSPVEGGNPSKFKVWIDPPSIAVAMLQRREQLKALASRRAIEDYDEALRLDPGDALAYNSRGNAYNNLGDFERAAGDWEQAIRVGGASWAKLWQEHMKGKGHYAGAIDGVFGPDMRRALMACAVDPACGLGD